MWAPHKLFGVDLHCIKCRNTLHSKGFYGTVRTVVAIDHCYLCVTWYHKCSGCNATYTAWSLPILDQLSPVQRQKFSVVLSYRSACDINVISLRRDRHIGNSPSAIHRMLLEQHSQKYLMSSLDYLTQVETFKASLASRFLGGRAGSSGEFPAPEPFTGLGDYRWLLNCYAVDVFQRRNQMRRDILMTFGCILKMDSTKKVLHHIFKNILT